MRLDDREVVQEAVLKRLHSSEGHLRAINRMVETDQPCAKILHQLHAVQASLLVIGRILITQQVQHSLNILENDPRPDIGTSELTRLSNLYSCFLMYSSQVVGRETNEVKP